MTPYKLIVSICILSTTFPQNVEGQGRMIHGRYFGNLKRLLKSEREFNTEKAEEYWFTQKLDHFTVTDTRTWQQKYYKNATFYQSGGPACIFVGGEGPADPGWVMRGEMVDQCSKLNGSIYMLEHRFYGESHPLPDASVESLKYLSIAQALGDLAKFIKYIKLQGVLTLEIKEVIVYGGSYAGSLVAYFRQKYPYLLATAALASSAPIHWKFDFYEYMEVVGRVIKKQSLNCYTTIQSGMAQFETIISDSVASGDTSVNSKLSPLKLCSELHPNNTLDVQNLVSGITGLFSLYVQYNHLLRHSIKEVCHFIDTSEEPPTEYVTLAKAINLMNEFNQNDCIDFSNENYCEWLGATGWLNDSVTTGARTWTWQVCNEVASLQSTSSEDQPFGIDSLKADLYVQQCQCAFDPKFTQEYIEHRLQSHMTLYGDYSTPRNQVVYTNGGDDPWGSIGVRSYEQLHSGGWSGDKRHNCVFLIEGASHCNDIGRQRASDSDALTQARNGTFKCLTYWLN